MKSRSKITKELAPKVIELYNLGLRQREIGEKFGISQTAIGTFLRKEGVKTRTFSEHHGITKEIELEVIKYYINGNGAMLCSKKFGFSEAAIFNIIKRNNIDYRNTSFRKYSFNKNYFENIDCKEKAYFLGFLMADGYNSNKSILLSIQEQDKYILEIFKKQINYTGELIFVPARKESYKNQYLIRFNSVKLCEDMSILGCVKAKSHYTYFPNIKEEYWSHFIRGLFDGDGCIHINYKDKNGNNKLRFSIMGNEKLIEKIQKILSIYCNITINKLYYKNKEKNNICNLSIGGNLQVKRIYKWLYKDCGELFLTRKKEKFELI